jgi:hypothetical protein
MKLTWEALRVISVNITDFWDVTSCSLVDECS